MGAVVIFVDGATRDSRWGQSKLGDPLTALLGAADEPACLGDSCRGQLKLEDALNIGSSKQLQSRKL